MFGPEEFMATSRENYLDNEGCQEHEMPTDEYVENTLPNVRYVADDKRVHDLCVRWIGEMDLQRESGGGGGIYDVKWELLTPILEAYHDKCWHEGTHPYYDTSWDEFKETLN